MCYNSILKQKVLMDANGRSSCIRVAWYKRTKKSESRGPHLNDQEKFILPVYFLETDDIVVFDKSSELIVFRVPGDMWKKPTQQDLKCSR